MFHVKHSSKSLFSNAKVAKDFIEQVFDADPASDLAKRLRRLAQLFDHQFRRGRAQRYFQVVPAIIQ
jgi:hypothetical protein